MEAPSRAAALLPLPQPYSWKVALLRQLIGWLSSEIRVLEQVTADLLAGHDGYRAVHLVRAALRHQRRQRGPRHRP